MVDVTESVASKGPTFVDISGESFRTYVFPNGGQATVFNPIKLNVKRKSEGDSHRVIDALGRSHYIPAGWIHLFWEGKDKQPQYSF